MKQFDIFILKENLNSSIKAGMRGVILEVYDSNTFEVEFVKDDGGNFTHDNQITFTIKKDLINKFEK